MQIAWIFVTSGLWRVVAQKSKWGFTDYDKEKVYRNVTQNKYCVILFKCVNTEVEVLGE